MRPLPTAADPVPGSALRPKRDPGSVKQAPRGLVVVVNPGLGSEVADLQVKCCFFLAGGAERSGLSLMETPDPGLSGDMGLEGRSGSSAERWLWDPLPLGRAFGLVELLAAALKTNSPWKR